MKPVTKLLVGAAIVGTILQSCESKKETEYKKTIHQKELINNFLHTREKENLSVPSAIEKAQNSFTDSDLKQALIDTLLRTPNTQTTTFDIKDMKKHKDNAIFDADSKSLLWMLGSLDTKEIMNTYNPQLTKHVKPDYNWERQDIRQLDSMTVPHIFPSMKNFFSPSLKDFLADKPRLKTMVGDYKTVIIITQLPDKHFGLGYYENGYITYAYPVSIGDAGRHTDIEGKRFHARTPQGHFAVQRKQADKRSKADDSMPYFLELVSSRGLGHHGQKTQSKRQSHGCVRGPHFGTKMLFQNAHSLNEQKSNPDIHPTHAILSRTPSKKELDSSDYYSKKPRTKAQRDARNSRKAKVLQDTLGIPADRPFVIDTVSHGKQVSTEN